MSDELENEINEILAVVSESRVLAERVLESLRARPQEPDCKHIRYDGRPWLEGFSYSNRPLSAFKTWVPKFCPDCGTNLAAPRGPLSDEPRLSDSAQELSKEGEMTKIVRSEFHSYHVTEERDMGILDAGVWEGQRFVTTKVAVGSSYEDAERLLTEGRHDLTGYRTENPDIWAQELSKEKK